MSDFSATWNLVRGRFDEVVLGLNRDQLNWRMQPGSMTAGEMALHVAGVEVSFTTQLLGRAPEGLESRLKMAATDGVVNENPFPFGADEITPELVKEALTVARELVAPMVDDPEPYRARTIKSALGPVVDGTGAFARLAYHPGYHHGQVHTLKTAPAFPA